MRRFKRSGLKTNQSGIALLLTLVILSVMVLIAVFIVNIVVTQLRLTLDIDYSQSAIYAADSGIEWQLYQIRQDASASSSPPIMSNGATVVTIVTGVSPNFTIKSLGSYQSIKRQFEVNSF